jgi:hypothetical protein
MSNKATIKALLTLFTPRRTDQRETIGGAKPAKMGSAK